MIYPGISLSPTKNPNKWAIAKLTLNRSFHDVSPLSKSHRFTYLLCLFVLFSWEREKDSFTLYSYCFKSKDKKCFVEFAMGKDMTNTMSKFFNTCFNFNRFFSQSHLKNDFFYLSLQNCSGVTDVAYVSFCHNIYSDTKDLFRFCICFSLVFRYVQIIYLFASYSNNNFYWYNIFISVWKINTNLYINIYM